MSDTRVTAQPWLWQPRTKPILFIEIHATRGDTTPEKQMGAALNWVQSARNVGNRKGNGTIDYLNPMWGSSFSHVIGTDGSMGSVLDDNQMPTYSAGYGGTGSEYAIDEYGISFELAQSQAQEPFTDALYERVTTEVAIKCQLYGIPPVFLWIPLQRGEVPTGLVRHDKCENGIKLGKTDPGDQFDESRFISMVVAKMEGEMGMTPAEAEEFRILKEQVKGMHDLHVKVEGEAGKHGPTGMTEEEREQDRITREQVGANIQQHQDPTKHVRLPNGGPHGHPHQHGEAG